MLALIDYGLIVVFFVVLFVLVLMIAHQPPEGAAAQKSVAAHTSTDIKHNKLSYGFLAALFVLFLVVTVLAERGPVVRGQRERSHAGSA